MKARIIVTLMIVLSMCMTNATALGDPGEEGYNAGYTSGYNHGSNGLDPNPGVDFDTPYDSGQPFQDYAARYKEGYSDGYDDGVASLTAGDKKDPVNSMSSPSMGIGFKLPDGTITKRGDQLPTLYTWAEANDKYEHHTTLVFPEEGTYTGCVIITPPQTAGEPLVPTGFWNTAKGLRILQWKANTAS